MEVKDHGIAQEQNPEQIPVVQEPVTSPVVEAEAVGSEEQPQQEDKEQSKETETPATPAPEPEPEPERPPTPPKPKITINLKSPTDKQTIEVTEDAGIREIKAIAAEKFSADPDYLCLIYSGKMMEDDDNLQTHNIQEGMTIHLIIKTAPREPTGPQRPPSDITQTPFGLNALGGLVGLESIGMGSANFMELQNRLQTELLGNPELLKRMLENPLVLSLMNDSKNMKKLIKQNPQMQELMGRHPEIRTMLNNSELLKNTVELAKNPSMLQELMRNLDGSNPLEENTSYTTLPNVFNAYYGAGLSAAASKVAEAQTRSDPGIFNNPQMSSLLQQMCENPQLIQNMMSAPYTQAMLQALAADPTMASVIVNENPLYKDNPALQQYLTSMMPQLIQQLQNPEILNMMSNPQALNALLTIQEGLDQLKTVAPGLVGNLGMGSFNNDVAEATASTSEEASATPVEPVGDNFSQYMARMVSLMSQGDIRQPPEKRFKNQMEHLKFMGFNNETLNLQTLTAVFGDINAAVQRLLAQNAKMPKVE